MQSSYNKVNALALLLDDAFAKEVEYLKDLRSKVVLEENGGQKSDQINETIDRLLAYQGIIEDVKYYCPPIS